MESKTKNKKTREQVAGMVERSFGGITLAAGEDALKELKEGWFNAAYTVCLSNGREAILKIAPPRGAEVMTYEQNIMSTEVASMRLVSQNPAIPVPKIYYFDTARDLCDSDYFFMEKIYGENLEHAKASLPAETYTAIQLRIGEIVREINSFTGTYFGYDGNPDLCAHTWKEAFTRIVDSLLEDGRRKNADYGFDAGDIRNAVLKHVSSLESVTTPRLVHWDAWDLNFLVKERRITGILDFERALWADPLMEAQFRALDWARVSEPMRGYGKTTFTHEEEERCRLYTLHLALVIKTECYYRNYDTDDASNIAKRLLAPSMHWLQEN
jgi:aminoglycoside phosphotransferase (APT) family kinase protein